MVLYWRDVTDSSGMVTAMKEAGIPVQVMKDDNIQDLAKAHSDVVWMAFGGHARGLERKVVVCLESGVRSARLHRMSRCTSQLVVVSHDD